MKATDFDLSHDLNFDPEAGIARFGSSRLLIFSADAIGLLRQKLRNELGVARTRDFFLAFGYQNGYADFLQMKINYQFDTEMDLVSSGPVIHTWEGIVKATMREIRFDRAANEYYAAGGWTNSYEAEQHLCFNQPDAEPVCWSLMGYATGWSTAFWRSPLIAIELFCVGKGDTHCEWLIQPPAAWGEKARPYLAAYQSFFDRLS